MKPIGKITALLSACIIAAVPLSGCSGQNGSGADSKAVTVRYLNFKPESAALYEEIAKAYKDETGVNVVVETAANNEYESTLTAKMATSEAPTIFQINGPRGYANWSDYCADLSNTEIYSHLTDKSLAISTDEGVWGIPYVVEGYGIIYNNAIMEKYFNLKNRATDIRSADEIKNFQTLSAVVKDMQKHKSELGINGVFASTSLKKGEDWRWQTHLANIPIYYEFKKNNTDLSGEGTKRISFYYAEQFKNIFDLYTDYSTVEKSTLGTKMVDESMAEFATGKAAMVQNGNWAWSQVKSVKGNIVKETDIKYMPVYTGMDGEEAQGLCIGTENYYAINAKASEQEQKAAADFIYWLYSSDKGKDYVTNTLGFIAPFDTFSDDEAPSDPLAKEVLRWMNDDSVTTIPWNFTLFPSQNFKDDFGAALLQYVQGSKSFEDVKKIVVEKWASESDAIE